MKKDANELAEHLYLKELSTRFQNHLQVIVNEFNHCKIISETLSNHNVFISAHTLARFFGLMKSNHRPYTSTLNLICEYIGYSSFAHFCKTIKEELEDALYMPSEAFSTGHYSLITLEIAIANEDWKNVQRILNSYQLNSSFNNELAMLLGNKVRQSNNKDIFLKKLIEIENGRLLFYESFVDEDDLNGYYSFALEKYYQSEYKNTRNQLFVNSFLLSQSIYKNKNQYISLLNSGVWKLDMPFEQLHFHELSRYLELLILIDFKQNKLKKSLPAHIDRILQHSNKVLHYERCWVVARSIKALAFSGFLKTALKDEAFRLLIEELYRKSTNKIESIAELIIQLTIHSIFKKEGDLSTIFPPRRITALHDNETNSRIIIEAANALLYSKGDIKSILTENVHSFAKKSGHTWVFDLLS